MTSIIMSSTIGHKVESANERLVAKDILQRIRAISEEIKDELRECLAYQPDNCPREDFCLLHCQRCSVKGMGGCSLALCS